MIIMLVKGRVMLLLLWLLRVGLVRAKEAVLEIHTRHHMMSYDII